MDTIHCITTDGFKLGRAMVGRHQEIDLPREEFDRLRGLGLVTLPEEVKAQEADAAKLAALELKEIQHKAQEEFQAGRMSRMEQRRAAEQRAAEAQAEKLQQAAEQARARGKRRGSDGP